MPGGRRAIRWIKRALRGLVWLSWLAVLFGAASAVTLLIVLWPQWLEIKAETISMAEEHRNYRTSHPGWSFPAVVYSAPFDLDGAPPERIALQAEARGYLPACPPTAPGEYCEEDGAVIPRGGTFQEGEQPPGAADWSRPLSLEPVRLGVLLGEEAEVRWHLPVEEAPAGLIAAILAAEDEDFYEHTGTDFVGLARAMLANYQGGGYKQGASTLSMQVVRNLNQRKEKTISRKLVEIASAIALDQHLGKEGVLQMYLDAPYLGQSGSLSICGFAAASEFYYGRDISELTLSEYATLAGILPAPGRYAPSRDPEAARRRRDLVLGRLAEAGWDVTGALAEPIEATEHPPLPLDTHVAYLQATRQWLESALPPETRFGAGLTVFTAMDVAAQVAGEELLSERVKYIERVVGRRQPEGMEAAGALIDYHTGHLVAVYGGTITQSTDFNRATQARRQAGSSFKPLVYALAFSLLDEDGLPAWRADDTVPNARREFPGTDGWRPRNISNGYTVTSSLAYGLAWSQNVAAASLLEALGGPQSLIDFATRLGYETVHFPVEMGLALGQGEVTPLEQARFVATVLSGGLRATGSPVITAVDPLGRVRLCEPALAEPIMTPEAALLTRELMRLVILNGTGGSSRWGGSFPGFPHPAVGKTGTTDKDKDLWFIGGTAYYASALWLGYDQPASIGASASDLAAPMWGWWMRAVHEGLPELEFTDPVPWERRTICTVSGRNSNGSCRLIGAPFLGDDKPEGRCATYHPPPDPEKKEYEGLWRRRRREKEEREAEAAAEAPAEAPVEGEEGG
ncbi:MAG: membrane peptidoglycan carboxypeptidase [Myxococcota bacterium]|jgi:membrane peptidoglycan carboxypeptidase